MPLVARADEEVVGDASRRAGSARHALDDPVGVLLRREPLLRGDAGDLRRVLVDAGEEERLVAALAVVAREDVRRDRRVRMPDVRRSS